MHMSLQLHINNDLPSLPVYYPSVWYQIRVSGLPYQYIILVSDIKSECVDFLISILS